MKDKAFTLGVLNGVFFGAVMAMINPGMVLSAFFLKLTNSTFLSTLPMALMQLGWIWPQIIISKVVETRERKKPFYVFAGVSRFIFLGLMAFLTFLLGSEHPGSLALICAILYFGYSSGAGVSGIPFWDIVGKTVPPTRRGRFMGLRGFFGGILSFASGFYIRYMLGESGPPFPNNYALIYATALFFLLISSSCFFAVPEPVKPIKKRKTSFREHLINGLGIFRRDRNYRLLFLVRVLGSLAYIGGVVFIPYAIKILGLPESAVGTFMVISTCFSLPSNFLWSHIGDRYGNRLLLLITTGISLMIPLIAIASYYLPPIQTEMPILGSAFNLRGITFMFTFALAGLVIAGRFIGDSNYLLEIAPDEQRPSYLAFMSVMLAPTSAIPLFGGMIAELISFQATFALSFLFGLMSYLLMFKLEEPRRRN
jgi:MFS family permease